MAKVTGMQMALDYPVDEVFAFVAECENEKLWSPELKSISSLTQGPVGAGSEWEASYRGMGSMRIRLADYRPTSLLDFTGEGPRMDMRFTCRFTGDDRHTVANFDVEMRPKGAMRAFGPLLGPMMRRTLQQRPAQLSKGLAKQRSVAERAELP